MMSISSMALFRNVFLPKLDLYDARLPFTLLDLPVLLSHCVAFMTDLNVGQIISNTNSLV